MRAHVARSTFTQLLDRDETLVSEIKSLDRDVQMLVYDNYSKFIGATNTMRSMKDKLFKMEGEVAGLEGRMEMIAKATRRMNERNATKREEIARLDRLGGLIDKLGMLFDLPQRLRNATQAAEIGHEVALYQQALPFLQANAHLPSFALVISNASEALDAIGGKLHRLLEDGFVGTPAEFEAVVSSLAFIDEGAEDLVKTYFDWHHRTILGTTLDIEPGASFEQHALAVRQALLDPLVNALARADALFPELDTDESKAALAKDVLRMTLERLRAKFDAEPSTLSQDHNAESGKAMLQGVSVAIAQLLTLEQQLPAATLKALRLRDRVGELAERAVRTKVDGVAAELRRRAQERLSVLPNEGVEGFKGLLDACAGGLIADAVSAHSYLTKLLESGATELAEVANSFQDVFRFQLQDWCLWLADELRPKGVAVHAVRANLLARALVARLVSGKTTSMGLNDAKDASAKLRKCSDEGLCAFVTLVGMDAAKEICAQVAVGGGVGSSSADEVDLGPPTQVRDSALHLLNEVANCTRLLRPAGVPLRSSSKPGGAQGEAAAVAPPSYTRDSGPRSGGKVGQDIARMFSEKLAVLDGVTLDVESMLAAALRVALKTWFETIRESYLTKHNFQQIVLDASFIKLIAPVLTVNPTAVHKVVNEVMTSARERCSNAVQLDQAAIDRLCVEKKALVRFFPTT